MASTEKDCFCLSRKTAVVLTGVTSLMVSLAGLLVAITSTLKLFPMPKDKIIRWILEVVFFLDIKGIVFHSTLLISSIFLVFGAVNDVPACLIVWVGWSPVVLSAIFVQMVIVAIQQPDITWPIVSFTVLKILFVMYCTVLVAARYRELKTVGLRVYNINSGELPRVVNVPIYIGRQTHRERRSLSRGARAQSSIEPLQEDIRARHRLHELRERVALAYGRFRRTVSQHRSQPGGPGVNPSNVETIL